MKNHAALSRHQDRRAVTPEGVRFLRIAAAFVEQMETTEELRDILCLHERLLKTTLDRERQEASDAARKEAALAAGRPFLCYRNRDAARADSR